MPASRNYPTNRFGLAVHEMRIIVIARCQTVRSTNWGDYFLYCFVQWIQLKSRIIVPKHDHLLRTITYRNIHISRQSEKACNRLFIGWSLWVRQFLWTTDRFLFTMEIAWQLMINNQCWRQVEKCQNGIVWKPMLVKCMHDLYANVS